MSRVTRAGIVALAMLSILVLAACGDDGGASSNSSAANSSPRALVADTFGSSQEVESGRLTLDVKVDAKDAGSSSESSSLSLRGPFELGRDGSLPKFDLDLALDSGSTKIAAGAISTGDRVWLEYGDTAYALPASAVKQLEDAAKKAERDGGGAKPTLASLGIDPRRWLTNPEIVGEETVGGDKTTHIRADVDVAKLIDDLAVLTKQAAALGGSSLGTSSQTGAPTLSAKDRRDIERALERATVDIWTGVDDHALRRLRVVADFDVPADARSRAGDLTSGSLALDVAIAELNEPQTIAAPANARPFSELQPLLSGLLGG